MSKTHARQKELQEFEGERFDFSHAATGATTDERARNLVDFVVDKFRPTLSTHYKRGCFTKHDAILIVSDSRAPLHSEFRHHVKNTRGIPGMGGFAELLATWPRKKGFVIAHVVLSTYDGGAEHWLVDVPVSKLQTIVASCEKRTTT